MPQAGRNTDESRGPDANADEDTTQLRAASEKGLTTTTAPEQRPTEDGQTTETRPVSASNADNEDEEERQSAHTESEADRSSVLQDDEVSAAANLNVQPVTLGHSSGASDARSSDEEDTSPPPATAGSNEARLRIRGDRYKRQKQVIEVRYSKLQRENAELRRRRAGLENRFKKFRKDVRKDLISAQTALNSLRRHSKRKRHMVDTDSVIEV